MTFTDNAYACAEGADALVIVTEWDAFRALDFRTLKTTMKTPTVVDLRNIYSAAYIDSCGFSYASIGRPIPSG